MNSSLISSWSKLIAAHMLTILLPQSFRDAIARLWCPTTFSTASLEKSHFICPKPSITMSVASWHENWETDTAPGEPFFHIICYSIPSHSYPCQKIVWVLVLKLSLDSNFQYMYQKHTMGNQRWQTWVPEGLWTLAWFSHMYPMDWNSFVLIIVPSTRMTAFIISFWKKKQRNFSEKAATSASTLFWKIRNRQRAWSRNSSKQFSRLWNNS